MLSTPGVALRNITVTGDLIIGDGRNPRYRRYSRRGLLSRKFLHPRPDRDLSLPLSRQIRFQTGAASAVLTLSSRHGFFAPFQLPDSVKPQTEPYDGLLLLQTGSLAVFLMNSAILFRRRCVLFFKGKHTLAGIISSRFTLNAPAGCTEIEAAANRPRHGQAINRLCPAAVLFGHKRRSLITQMRTKIRHGFPIKMLTGISAHFIMEIVQNGNIPK